MKHKLLISLVAVLGLTTAINITNQNVQAKTWHISSKKYPLGQKSSYWNKWRHVILNTKTTFAAISLVHGDDLNRSSASYPVIYITKKPGTDLWVRHSSYHETGLNSVFNDRWEIKGDTLRKYPYRFWTFKDPSIITKAVYYGSIFNSYSSKRQKYIALLGNFRPVYLTKNIKATEIRITTKGSKKIKTRLLKKNSKVQVCSYGPGGGSPYWWVIKKKGYLNKPKNHNYHWYVNKNLNNTSWFKLVNKP